MSGVEGAVHAVSQLESLGNEPFHWFAKQRVAVVAKKQFGLTIHQQDTPIRVHFEQRVRTLLDHGAEPRLCRRTCALRSMELLFQLFTSGDVADNSLQAAIRGDARIPLDGHE